MRYIGLFIGTLYLLIAFGAFKNGMEGWSAGHADLGVWWTVIGGLLAIAGFGAIIGTWIHAWTEAEEH